MRTSGALPGNIATQIEVLFREARRRRRRRWILGFIISAIALSSVTVLALHGDGGKRPLADRTQPRPPRVGTSKPLSPEETPGVLLNRPQAMAIAPNGNVLVSNEGSSQVLERLPNGTLISVAGDGRIGFSGDGGPASAAELDDPEGIAVSPAGTIYVADRGNNRIRAIAPTGTISTFAQVQSPSALAIGPSDLLYVVDSAGVQTVATNGAVATVIPETSMVNGAIVHEVSIGGTSSAFFPSAIAVSPSGAIYIANSSPKFLFEDDRETLSLVGQASLFGGQTYVTGAGLSAAPDGDIYVSDYGAFGIDRVKGTTLKPVFTFQLKSVAGLDGFRPSGVAIGRGGEIYTDTDGVNGGSDRPALVRIDSDGHAHLLDVGPISS